jgi:4-hydroxy-3-polyprenylbenzoate decarboxylase
MALHLIVAMTGASGAYAGELLLRKSPWPTMLIASKWARQIYAHECGPVAQLEKLAGQVFDNADMLAAPASGSVPTAGMVILPCSANTLGQIAGGLGETLIARAAHCHLKERLPLVLGLRETPLSVIDLQNAATAAAAGATVMPLSPPFFMFKGRSPQQVSLHDVMEAYVDRVLALLGHPMSKTWEDVR